MKIIVDKDGSDAVSSLIDLYLRTNGLAGLDGAINIVRSIEEYIEQKPTIIDPPLYEPNPYMPDIPDVPNIT